MIDDTIHRLISEVIKRAAERAFDDAKAMRPVMLFGTDEDIYAEEDEEDIAPDTLIVEGSLVVPLTDEGRLVKYPLAEAQGLQQPVHSRHSVASTGIAPCGPLPDLEPALGWLPNLPSYGSSHLFFLRRGKVEAFLTPCLKPGRLLE